MKLFALISTLLPLLGFCIAQETTPPKPVKPAPPTMEKLDDHRYRIGKILINSKTRTVTIPASINTLDAPLEYILVLEKGQSHESLLRTEILPFHLNIALLTLGVNKSQELFPILDKNGLPTDQYHPVTPEAKAYSRLNLFLAIPQPDGTTKELPLNGLVLLSATLKPLPSTPWIYNGSYFHKDRFKADLKGNLISIIQDTSALINCPLDNREGDRLWIANKKYLPTSGTAVKLLIKPAPQQ